MKAPRLLLVEDHPLVQEGLRALLAAQYEIVATIADGEAVVEAYRSHRPDVVLLDLSLPKRGGMALIGDLIGVDPEARIVVVTMHADRALAANAFRIGALGFVPKDAPIAHFHTAIRQALAGRQFLSPAVPKAPGSGDEVQPLGLGLLTERQRLIVRLIGQGLTSEQIGERLGVSKHTISFHRQNIWKQLGIQNDREMFRYALMVEAMERGLVSEAGVEQCGERDDGGSKR